jgi:hypothetical protein
MTDSFETAATSFCPNPTLLLATEMNINVIPDFSSDEPVAEATSLEVAAVPTVLRSWACAKELL